MACLSKQWGRRSIIYQHAESLRRSVLHKIYQDNLRASLEWCSTMELGVGWYGCSLLTIAAKLTSAPSPKYILLGSCTGPSGKVFFTHRSAHSQVRRILYTNTCHVRIFKKKITRSSCPKQEYNGYRSVSNSIYIQSPYTFE